MFLDVPRQIFPTYLSYLAVEINSVEINPGIKCKYQGYTDDEKLDIHLILKRIQKFGSSQLISFNLISSHVDMLEYCSTSEEQGIIGNVLEQQD